jgi:Tfp pilus assembly protein PilN
MIRINLLESITDKPVSAALLVEKRVSNPVNRMWLMAGVVGGLMILAMGFDYFTASSARAAADAELANQQQIATQMEAIIKEQAELDQKIKNVDERITAIKDLRAKQAGPSAVLDALRERIGNSPGLYLEAVEQKGDQLTIRGNSPDEYVVSGFGRSLEFSSGLFSNLNIETQRKELAATQISGSDGTAGSNPDAKVPETVNFTIRCAYTPSKAAQPSTLPNGQPATTQTASNQPPSGVPGVPTNNPPPAAKQ